MQHLGQHLAQAYLPRTHVTFAMPELCPISAAQRQALAQTQNDVQAHLYMPHGSTQMTVNVINHVLELEQIVLTSVYGERLDLDTSEQPGTTPPGVSHVRYLRRHLLQWAHMQPLGPYF